MVYRTVSLFNYVPSFARGSNIMLVHNDRHSLRHLSSLLRQCSFIVTATNQASAAINMICQQEGRFKLVMAKADMPDMTTFSFLNKLLVKQIPVIFLYSGQSDSVARAALHKGLCYLLEEPIQPEDLICVWQQFYHPNSNLAIEIQNAKAKEQACLGKVHEASENQNGNHDVRGKRAKLSSHHTNSDRNHHTAEEESEETREHNNDGSTEKRPRISWTPDLHQKFVKAISELGNKNIRPKEILQLMNVPNLTRRHVASHLQRFKTQVRHPQETCITDLPPASISSNFRDETKSSSSFERQTYPGYPTLAALQSEDQNHNWFPMTFPETRGPEIFKLQETPGYANVTFQPPTELVNYRNQYLDAAVRGAMPDASMDNNQYVGEYNKMSKFQREDSDKYNCFENGSSRDDTARNSEMLKNYIFANSSSSQQFDNSYSSFLSLLKEKPSAAMGEFEPDAWMDQNKTLTEHNNILRIFGANCTENDCSGNEPSKDDIAVQRNSIFGNSSSAEQSDNCNTSCV